MNTLILHSTWLSPWLGPLSVASASRWLGNSRTLGLSGRLANRHSDTKLARAGPAGAERGVTNYSKSRAKLMADNHLSLRTPQTAVSAPSSAPPFSLPAGLGWSRHNTKDLSCSASRHSAASRRPHRTRHTVRRAWDSSEGHRNAVHFADP